MWHWSLPADPTAARCSAAIPRGTVCTPPSPGMHWKGGRYPPPPQGPQPTPSHCLLDGKCQLQQQVVTDNNRPQPLWQPPLTARCSAAIPRGTVCSGNWRCSRAVPSAKVHCLPHRDAPGAGSCWKPGAQPPSSQSALPLRTPTFLVCFCEGQPERTAPKDHQPPTAANRQPPTANRRQPLTANRQPPPTTNRQPPTTTNH